MYIEKLTLKNYRNYLSETFEFSPGVNIVSGANAQGKTNAAEAIFYLCTGYSPRVTREKQVINYDADKASVCAVARTAFGSVSASLDFYREGGKKITVNGLVVQKTGELLGNIDSVLFNPQELKLVQETPEDRRRFLDVSLSQLGRTYYYTLQKYKKILVQRNNLLKTSDKSLIFDTLPIWDEQLADAASRIVSERNGFIARLKPACRDAHAFISGGTEDLCVEGDYCYSGEVAEIKRQLKAAYAENMEKDVALGYTSVGPHRDDLKIKLAGRDLRIYGSQGQQRTAALSLKLAELEIFKERYGEYPVLILDDAMSELDGARRKRLLSKISDVQTIITCTDADADFFTLADRRFVVDCGKIVRQI